MGFARPPLEYLITSSQTSLESFELSRLNAVANLRKEIRQVVDDWVEAEIEARIARWVLERRRAGLANSQADVPQLSDSFLCAQIGEQSVQSAAVVHTFARGDTTSGLHDKYSHSSQAGHLSRATVLHGNSLPQCSVHSAGQQLAFEGLHATPDPVAETAPEANSLEVQFAPVTLGVPDRYAQSKTKMLRRKVCDTHEETAVLSDHFQEPSLRATLVKPIAAGIVAALVSSGDDNPCAIHIRPCFERNVAEAGTAHRQVASIQKSERPERHSDLRLLVVCRAALRQIQLHRFCAATAT